MLHSRYFVETTLLIYLYHIDLKIVFLNFFILDAFHTVQQLRRSFQLVYGNDAILRK